MGIKHDFYLDSTDERDDFRLEYDNHMGPQCIRCRITFCVFCYPEDLDEDCLEQTSYLF